MGPFPASTPTAASPHPMLRTATPQQANRWLPGSAPGVCTVLEPSPRACLCGTRGGRSTDWNPCCMPDRRAVSLSIRECVIALCDEGTGVKEPTRTQSSSTRASQNENHSQTTVCEESSATAYGVFYCEIWLWLTRVELLSHSQTRTHTARYVLTQPDPYSHSQTRPRSARYVL